MGNEVMAALFGAILAGAFAIWTTRSTLNDSLDSKSDWRKNLFDIASKSKITLDDVYRVRASLRYEKHDSVENLCSFKGMTNIMIDFCNHIIDSKQISDINQKIIRIFCRYLLKHHWEYNRNNFLRFFSYDDIKLGSETLKLVGDIMSKDKDENKAEDKIYIEKINQIIDNNIECSNNKKYILRENLLCSTNINLVVFVLGLILEAFFENLPIIQVLNVYNFFIFCALSYAIAFLCPLKYKHYIVKCVCGNGESENKNQQT